MSKDATSVLGVAEAMDDDSLAAAAVLVDLAIWKGTGANLEHQLVALELRLFQTLGDSWVERASSAIPAALSGLTGDAVATTADVKRITARLARGFDGWDRDVAGTLKAVIRETYHIAKEQAVARVAGKLDSLKPQGTPHQTAEAIAKAKKKPKLKVEATFDLMDERAMESMTRNQLHWIGQHYDMNLSARITELVRANMIERGLGRKQAGALLRKALEGELGVNADGQPTVHLPTSWAGPPAQYFEGLAANVATTARNYGAIRQFATMGVQKLEIVNPNDERQCERCRFMDGRTFTITRAMDRISKAITAKTPDAVRAAHPWAGSVKEMETSHKQGRLEKDFTLPPFHFRCRCGTDLTEDFEPTFE